MVTILTYNLSDTIKQKIPVCKSFLIFMYFCKMYAVLMPHVPTIFANIKYFDIIIGFTNWTAWHTLRVGGCGYDFLNFSGCQRTPLCITLLWAMLKLSYIDRCIDKQNALFNTTLFTSFANVPTMIHKAHFAPPIIKFEKFNGTQRPTHPPEVCPYHHRTHTPATYLPGLRPAWCRNRLGKFLAACVVGCASLTPSLAARHSS